MKPRLLDLFCGAGGAAMGYHRAGFEVVGVDINPQPRYPFKFVQGDALDWPDLWPENKNVVAVHASPPCQAYTLAQRLRGNKHPDLLERTRALLVATGLPYVIENVPGAPLRNFVVLEGQMFPDLNVHRPRWFEVNWPIAMPLLIPPPPRQTKMGRPTKSGEAIQVVGNFSGVAEARRAMGIEWMTQRELSQAIPPTYTEFIGRQLLDYLNAGDQSAEDESPTKGMRSFVSWRSFSVS